MGKTIRRLPYGYLRNPRGRMAALRRGDRSIPPAPWDDDRHSNESLAPWNFADHRVREGKSEATVIQMLRKKYGLSNRRAREVAIKHTRPFRFWFM